MVAACGGKLLLKAAGLPRGLVAGLLLAVQVSLQAVALGQRCGDVQLRLLAVGLPVLLIQLPQRIEHSGLGLTGLEHLAGFGKAAVMVAERLGFLLLLLDLLRVALEHEILDEPVNIADIFLAVDGDTGGFDLDPLSERLVVADVVVGQAEQHAPFLFGLGGGAAYRDGFAVRLGEDVLEREHELFSVLFAQQREIREAMILGVPPLDLGAVVHRLHLRAHADDDVPVLREVVQLGGNVGRGLVRALAARAVCGALVDGAAHERLDRAHLFALFLPPGLQKEQQTERIEHGGLARAVLAGDENRAVDGQRAAVAQPVPADQMQVRDDDGLRVLRVQFHASSSVSSASSCCRLEVSL